MNSISFTFIKIVGVFCCALKTKSNNNTARAKILTQCIEFALEVVFINILQPKWPQIRLLLPVFSVVCSNIKTH